MTNTVIERLKKADACWLYKGNPRADAPHALLTSGKHSDGFINVGQVLKNYPDIRMDFAKEIVASLCGIVGSFDYVVGADTSSTDLVGDIARITGACHIRMIKTDDKKQLWHPDNIPLLDGEIILQVEELITTSFSAAMVREGIRNAFPQTKIKFAAFLPTIVDRSDPDNRIISVEDSVIVPLLKLDIRNYDQDCPYCAAGSKAIRPKEGDNWSLLMNS